MPDQFIPLNCGKNKLNPVRWAIMAWLGTPGRQGIPGECISVTIENKSRNINECPAARLMLKPIIKEKRGQARGLQSSQKREGRKMKMFKMLFVLFCLLAYTWVFSLPAKGQDVQPRRSSHPAHAAADTTLPFKAIVEKDSPLFGDRQMTLKIGDVAAGQQVTVLENHGAIRVDRPVVLLVSHADASGKEHTGYFYGTLRVRVPH